MWYETNKELPAEGVTVLTMDSSGREQLLKRRGKLWWFPDMSMYIYYVPVRWRHV